MRRKKQALTLSACEAVLTAAPRGVLSVLGDDGYPYGIPMNHVYVPADHALYFHTAGAGHKMDALRRHPKASFCVFDGGFRREGEWALNIQSVVCFGTVTEITDAEKKKAVLTLLVGRFTDDAAYLERELARSFHAVHVLQFAIQHCSGKLVNES